MRRKITGLTIGMLCGAALLGCGGQPTADTGVQEPAGAAVTNLADARRITIKVEGHL